MRGDTVPACVIARLTDTATGDPIGIESARMQMRQGATVVHEWSTGDGTLTIGGTGDSELVRTRTTAEDTALWPVGSHPYDLEITTTAGDVWTVLTGAIQVLADVTR
jgi:hypothetical protein